MVHGECGKQRTTIRTLFMAYTQRQLALLLLPRANSIGYLCAFFASLSRIISSRSNPNLSDSMMQYMSTSAISS